MELFVGAILGALVSWIFYFLGGRDLRQVAGELKAETARIQRLNEINLSTLEDAGLVKLNRDTEGRIVGTIVELRGTSRATSSISGSLSTRSSGPDNNAMLDGSSATDRPA